MEKKKENFFHNSQSLLDSTPNYTWLSALSKRDIDISKYVYLVISKMPHSVEDFNLKFSLSPYIHTAYLPFWISLLQMVHICGLPWNIGLQWQFRPFVTSIAILPNLAQCLIFDNFALIISYYDCIKASTTNLKELEILMQCGLNNHPQSMI